MDENLGAGLNFEGLDAIGPDSTVEPAPDAAPQLGADDLKLLQGEAEERKKYADRPVEAATLSALGTASWSLSDRLLKKLGIRSEEDLQKIREYNKGADTLGLIGGTIAPMLLEGPAAGAAGAARKGAVKIANAATEAGRLTEGALLSATRGLKNQNLAKEIVRKSIASGSGSAVEGAAFGANQLLREDALGEADFNADNLMGAAGTGAIYGGILGAATPSIAAAAKGLTKGATNLVEKGMAKTLDRVENAAQLVGETAKQKAAAMTDALRAEERAALPDIIAEEIKAGSKFGTAEERLATWEKLQKSTREDLKNFYDRVDELKATQGYNPNVPMQTSDVLLGKLNALESEIVEPALKTRTNKAIGRRLKNIADDYRDWIAAEPYPSAKRMWEKRKEFDKMAKWEVNKPTQEMDFFKRLRGDLDSHLRAYAEGWAPGMTEELNRLNLRSRVAMRYAGSLAKKAAKDPKLFQHADLPYALIAGGFQNPVALGILGTKKFLESDFKRRLVVLSSIEKANKAVMAQIKSAASNFVEKAARPAKSLSTRALVQSHLSFDHSKKDGKPAGKQEAFKNIQKNLIDLQINNDQFAQRVEKSSAVLKSAAPKTAEAFASNMINAVNFLAEKLPKNPYDVEIPGVSGREYVPSAAELSKFERYVQVVESPISVLNELESGTLTRDHVEALQAVYPAFYRKLNQEVNSLLMDRDSKGQPSLPYNKRVQLSILFGQPSDSSMTGPAIMSLQSTFQPAQDQRNMAAAESRGMVPASQKGLQNLDMAGRTAAGSESVLRRRSES